MDTSTQEDGRLREAVTACLNAHDLLGVMNYGAPATEYDPEMEDFARLIAEGETITPERVATVWHKCFGEPSEGPDAPTAAMHALSAALRNVRLLGRPRGAVHRVPVLLPSKAISFTPSNPANSAAICPGPYRTSGGSAASCGGSFRVGRRKVR
jgi:hypothetical protein